MPFNFMELPQEVQDMIFTEHLRCDKLTVKSKHRTPGTPYVDGMPSLAIESVCRKFNQDAKQLRSQQWPRILHFDLEATLATRVTRVDAIILVGTDNKYEWLHHHIQHISGSKTCLPYPAKALKFENLQHFTMSDSNLFLWGFTYASLEALQEDLMHEKRALLSFVCRFLQRARFLSRGCEHDIRLTLAETARVDNPKLDAKIQLEFKSNTGPDRSLRAHLISAKFTTEGKEDSALFDGWEELLINAEE